MDFDNLRDKIIEERDTILFEESVSCLKGNAYRAAYITNWISIAESLKFKFYDMSLRDNEIQKKVIGKIEDLEDKERPTDSLLIRSAEQFGLITKEQKLKLDHIKTMRGVYAHPLNSAPSKQEVELAIELSVNIVLSQPPLLKHAFVQDLVKSIFEKHHFLDDNLEKIKNYAEVTLNHINPTVFPYFFKLLIQNIDRVSVDFTKELFMRRGKVFLDVLLKKSIGDDFSTEIWKVNELLHSHSLIVANTFINEELWPFINETVQDSIVGYLIEPIKDGEIISPSIENIEKMLNLSSYNLLTERHIERLKHALERCSINKKMIAGVPFEWYQDELITELKSRNWYAQNPVIEVIENLGAEKINALDQDYLIDLGRNILQAADGGARDLIEFVQILFKRKDKWSSYLIEGIFLETFINNENKLRFKKYFKSAFLAVIATDKQERERIIYGAIEMLKKSSPKGWLTEKSFENNIQLLQDIFEKADKSENVVIQERKEIIQQFKIAFEETRDRILSEEEEE
ncbi:hypothetical protein [Lysinibacillus capsici]|uniref:hypothetical protein n=1 Tax=Lysinibacillus capsici TaxID=2115968 RepID=UPI003BA85D7E